MSSSIECYDYDKEIRRQMILLHCISVFGIVVRAIEDTDLIFINSVRASITAQSSTLGEIIMVIRYTYGVYEYCTIGLSVNTATEIKVKGSAAW